MVNSFIRCQANGINFIVQQHTRSIAQDEEMAAGIVADPNMRVKSVIADPPTRKQRRPAKKRYLYRAKK